jgi:predicted transcriptional regulator of viral defense system
VLTNDIIEARKENPMNNKILDFLKENDGMITTKDAVKAGIPKVYLTQLVRDGIIERIRSGVYLDVNSFGDEYYLFQVKYPSAIFSHNTALYFYNMTERTPNKLDVTIYRGYNPHRFPNIIRVYSITKSNHMLGVISVVSPQGKQVLCTNLERTLCDIIRSEKSLDQESRNKSIRWILRSGKLDEKKLDLYAKTLKCSKKLSLIREYL